MIETMGLFWKASDVFWGKPNRQGTLLGRRAKQLKSKPVNFREQAGIYVLYAGYNIVYVGQTGRGNQKLFYRLRQHLNHDLSERWDRFSWFGLRKVLKNGKLGNMNDAAHVSLEQVLNYIEGVLIHVSEPPLNRQGGRLKDVERYIQEPDGELQLSDREMLCNIYKKLHGHKKK